MTRSTRLAFAAAAVAALLPAAASAKKPAPVRLPAATLANPDARLCMPKSVLASPAKDQPQTICQTQAEWTAAGVVFEAR